MARARGSPPHIHKFGGASLANAAGITHAAKIVVAYRPAPQVVVVSAMSGVTDALLECAARASRGDAAHVRTAAKTLRARHLEAARALVRRGARLDELVGLIDAAFAELEQLAGGLGILRDVTPRTTDYVVARVHCSCGNEFLTRSTKPELSVEICSECHPFYTGKQKLVDTAGRVERFRRKYGANAAK